MWQEYEGENVDRAEMISEDSYRAETEARVGRGDCKGKIHGSWKGKGELVNYIIIQELGSFREIIHSERNDSSIMHQEKKDPSVTKRRLVSFKTILKA